VTSTLVNLMVSKNREKEQLPDNSQLLILDQDKTISKQTYRK